MGKKIVLVTGANKGIGFGIAKHLGLSGWQVVIGARDEQRATKAIGELKAEGIDVLGWVNIELKDLDGIDKAAKEINERYPELSLLVNNAGIPGDMSVCQEWWPYCQCHRTLRDQSLLAPVGLRCQQGCTECHDGCDGHRIPAGQYPFGNLLRSSWTYDH